MRSAAKGTSFGAERAGCSDVAQLDGCAAVENRKRLGRSSCGTLHNEVILGG